MARSSVGALGAGFESATSANARLGALKGSGAALADLPKIDPLIQLSSTDLSGTIWAKLRAGVEVQHTAPSDDVIAKLKLPPGVKPTPPLERVVAEAMQPNRCTSVVVVNAGQAESGLSNVLHDPIERDRAVREYVRNLDAYRATVAKHVFDAVESYVKAMRDLLDRCYAPAERHPTVVAHSLETRVGSLDLGGISVCTATSLGDGEHVVTARHCLFRRYPDGTYVPMPEATLKTLWFAPVSGGDRYQVCGADEPDALSPAKLQPGGDRIVLKTAGGHSKAPAMKIAARTSLHPFLAAPGDPDAPTTLLSVSVFPLARVLDVRYPSNMVAPTVRSCVVYSADASCFRHFCGTVEASSGSPLFLDDAAALWLVGTHVGFNQGARTCGLAKPVGSNYAVFADEAALQRRAP